MKYDIKIQNNSKVGVSVSEIHKRIWEQNVPSVNTTALVGLTQEFAPTQEFTPGFYAPIHIPTRLTTFCTHSSLINFLFWFWLKFIMHKFSF